MFLEADMHCHTVASTHAYSTVTELVCEAAQKGLKAIAVTDHAPGIPDGAHLWHFGNLKSLPPYIRGVRVLHGAETNVIDYNGGIDLPEECLKKLDWVIASMHEPPLKPGTERQHTEAYLKLAENPYVDAIGHSGGDKFKYDYEKVLPVFKTKRILIEINSHSFEARAGSSENCREIALLCKKYSIPVIVNSDAHVSFAVGEVSEALKMLESIDFPRELIINLTFERLAEWILSKKNINIMKQA